MIEPIRVVTSIINRVLGVDSIKFVYLVFDIESEINSHRSAIKDQNQKQAYIA